MCSDQPSHRYHCQHHCSGAIQGVIRQHSTGVGSQQHSMCTFCLDLLPGDSLTTVSITAQAESNPQHSRRPFRMTLGIYAHMLHIHQLPSPPSIHHMAGVTAQHSNSRQNSKPAPVPEVCPAHLPAASSRLPPLLALMSSPPASKSSSSSSSSSGTVPTTAVRVSNNSKKSVLYVDLLSAREWLH